MLPHRSAVPPYVFRVCATGQLVVVSWRPVVVWIVPAFIRNTPESTIAAVPPLPRMISTCTPSTVADGIANPSPDTVRSW